MTRRFLPGLLAVAFLLSPSVVPSARAADKAEVQGMIQRGVKFLYDELKKSQGDGNGDIVSSGHSTLAAYACIKGGVKPTDPVIQKVVKMVQAKVAGGKYKPGSEVIYTIGVEMMFLEAAGGKAGRYRKELQIMVDYVVKNQAGAGYWNYLGTDKEGDTSVTQYGILGLWAAARAGIKVPPTAWDKTASWLRATQHNKTGGGFSYRPTSSMDSGVTSSMTVAGVSTLLVTQRYLHPEKTLGNKKKKKKKKVIDIRRYLRKIDTKSPINKKKPKGKKKKKIDASDYKAVNSFNQISGAEQNGFRWLAARYRPGEGRWAVYTLYGIERMAALKNVQFIGRLNWFDSGVAWLKKNEKSGTWNDTTGKVPATSFAVLFLTKSTMKTLGRSVDLYGDGLLRGGQGLPDDLSTIGEGKDGKIKKRKISGPVDSLLSELMNPQTKLDVPELQKAIVKKIQLGNRDDWLKPKKRKQLLEMAEHPKPEVRMVAVWALGRTGNIDIVTILMDTLEKDPDLSVAIEARNALCWLSRKPKGFGLPEDPKSDIPPTATKEQRLAAIAKWRKDAVAKWKKWYLTVRPYKERDDVRDIGEER